MNDASYQLGLFAAESSPIHKTQESDSRTVASHNWSLYIDGASRNNPGIAGAGIYLLRDGVPLYQDGYWLGHKTNNQAEYLALLLGLFNLKQWYTPEDRVYIFSDSQLLVRQLQGIYKVRNELLKPLYTIALSFMREMHAHIEHIMREDNIHADKMANHGIDTKKPVPPVFVRMLEHYDVAM